MDAILNKDFSNEKYFNRNYKIKGGKKVEGRLKQIFSYLYGVKGHEKVEGRGWGDGIRGQFRS